MAMFPDALNGLLGLCILSVLTVCLFLELVSRRAKLSHIPGPWQARYTDAWSLHAAWKISSAPRTSQSQVKLAHYKRLQALYGDVVRVGPRTVIVFDAAAVPTVYGVRAKLDKASTASTL